MLVIGKYIRLSQADADVMETGNKEESDSISNQRELIQRYIDSNPSLVSCEQYEFFDDGYTGTNFKRPGFENLMEKVKKGEINCIIVKDFSRFGRNYIELGDYLERIFPFLGVRFISINDSYDSEDYKGTTGGFDVVMKNIVYDFYSKDLSVKVTTAKMSKMKQGLYSSGKVPYGLKKHDTIKGKLVIDAEAAKIVRKIFDYALQGFKTGDIARELNKEHILTPAQYYTQKNPHLKNYSNKSKELAWGGDMAYKILKNEMYYGAMVGHKRERVSIGNKRTKMVPKEERIIVEGTHEAIVSKEEWIMAQQVIGKMKKIEQCKKRNYILKGKARCGCCGRMLLYCESSISRYFKCAAFRCNPESKCMKENVSATLIEDVVWSALQVIFQNLENMEKKEQQTKLEKERRTVDVRKQISLLQRELEQKESLLFLWMDQLNDGIMSKSLFLEKKTQIKSEMDNIRSKIEMLEKNQQETVEIDPEIRQFQDCAKNYAKEEKLTRQMVQAFIDCVSVFDKEHIEIKWNFSDEVLEKLNF